MRSNNRKRMLIITALILFTLILGACRENEGTSEGYEEFSGPLLLGYSVRTLANPYYEHAVIGIDQFVSNADDKVSLEVLEHFASDENQIEDIKRLIAKGGKDVILVIDPNRVDNVYEVAKICEENQVYWSTIWTRPEDLHPKDYHYYVSHQEVDNVKAGYEIAKTMFESFEEDKVFNLLAIGGDEKNNASIDRVQGLMDALEEYPDINLMDLEYANWSPQESLKITEDWISSNDEDIHGIWVANDVMALAVIDALKGHDLNGKVLVVGVDGIAIDALQSGDLTASYSPIPWVQASYSAAITYSVYSGKVNKNDMTLEQMSFYTNGMLLTGDNVDEFKEMWIKELPELDFDNPFKYVDRAKK